MDLVCQLQPDPCEKVYFTLFVFFKVMSYQTEKPLDYLGVGDGGVRSETTQLCYSLTRALWLVPWRQPRAPLQPGFLSAPGWEHVQGGSSLLCRK